MLHNDIGYSIDGIHSGDRIKPIRIKQTTPPPSIVESCIRLVKQPCAVRLVKQSPDFTVPSRAIDQAVHKAILAPDLTSQTDSEIKLVKRESRASASERAQIHNRSIPFDSSSSRVDGLGLTLRVRQLAAPSAPAGSIKSNSGKLGGNRTHLLSGESVTGMWLYSNGLRLSREDTARLLDTPQLKAFCRKMLECWSAALQNVYIAGHCAVWKRKTSSWKSQPGVVALFLRAAKHAATAYAQRGFDIDAFMAAAVEIRPKAVKFPTPEMLAGAVGARVLEWVPPEERIDESWNNWTDDAGITWVKPSGSSDAYPLIRGEAGRALLQRMIHGQ